MSVALSGPGSPGLAFHPSGALMRIGTDDLLALFERYEEAAATPGEASTQATAAIQRVAVVLAQRLPINCPAYAALVCEGSTANDWRAMFELRR
ncbi:MAG TPA: hypothetical protein VFS20_09760 [Longimicrobium sp.]|nr:hypothetical protein [Longimicrobium sp.]